MKRLFAVTAVWGALLLAAPVSGQMGMRGQGGMMGGGGMMGTSMVRHRYAMMNGIDPKYANLVNPLAATAENIAAGAKLYGPNCATCHGATGRGDGTLGQKLNPPPTDLAALSRMPIATDAYLDWSIADGGVPLGTAMPAFKGSLSQKQIWEIIIFLRTL
jgi:mono/diheme cytochrome c family protein